MKYRADLHEELNTSKGVIWSSVLALATEVEIASSLGKQGVTNIWRISIRKDEERIQTNTFWHLISPVLPRRWRSAIVFGEASSTSQLTWDGSNAKHMDTIGKPIEDDRHVPNAVKRMQTTWRKILWYSQKEKEILEVKHKRNVPFLEAREIVGTNMEKSNYASVARRVNTTNEDNKYRTLMEKLIQLEANYWPKILEQLKKLHSAKFYQTLAQQQVGNGEKSNLIVQT